MAEALGYSNSRKALADHVQDDDKGVTKWNTLGGKQDLTIINESGLYSLIMSSKLPTAKQFKRWVTAEVLPTIRKNGAYLTDKTALRYQPPPHKTYIPPFSIVNGGRRNIIPRTSPINTVFKAFYCETV